MFLMEGISNSFSYRHLNEQCDSFLVLKTGKFSHCSFSSSERLANLDLTLFSYWFFKCWKNLVWWHILNILLLNLNILRHKFSKMSTVTNDNYEIFFMLIISRNQQENAMRCNDCDDLLQLSLTLKISIFLEA